MADPLTNPAAFLTLVEPATAKEQLRIDGTADDAWLNVALAGVSQAVIRWCGGDVAKLRDAEGQTLPDVTTAVLVEVAKQYADREGPQNAYELDWYKSGYTLSAGATAFLQPFHPVVTA